MLYICAFLRSTQLYHRDYQGAIQSFKEKFRNFLDRIKQARKPGKYLKNRIVIIY